MGIRIAGKGPTSRKEATGVKGHMDVRGALERSEVNEEARKDGGEQRL